jgi:hypothetical protein
MALEGTMQSDSVGVERRRLPFTLIENIILEDQALGPVDVLVYLALAKHADGEGACWPSMATIAKVARVCRSKAFQAIKHLEALGYLKRTARFRADGGVTSNAYKLMPIEARRYPHVAPNDTPCHSDKLPPVHHVDANYIQSEQDPREGGAPARCATLPRAYAHPPSPSQTEDEVIRELKDLPGLIHDRRFREGAHRLLAEGKSVGEIARAVRAAAADPQERGGLSFIADRFPRWIRKALERERQENQLRQDAAAQEERQRRERTRLKERERLLRERENPYWQKQIAAAIEQLPWRRVRA